MALWAVLSAAATAADSGPYWTVTLGAEGRVQPRWEGSSRYTILPMPLFDVRRAGMPEPFRGPRDGFAIGLIDTGQFRAGPVGKLRLPRKQSDDGRLIGLGDVDWAAELGAFADYWWAPWLRTRAELRQGFGGHHGVVGELMADALLRASRQLTLSAGPRLTIASTSALAPYFSITAAQAAASGLPAFDAKGGVHAAGFGAQARYLWTPQWGTHIFAEYERLIGGARRSPLVSQRGSANQWTFGVGVTYAFDVRAWW